MFYVLQKTNLNGFYMIGTSLMKELTKARPAAPKISYYSIYIYPRSNMYLFSRITFLKHEIERFLDCPFLTLLSLEKI